MRDMGVSVPEPWPLGPVHCEACHGESAGEGIASCDHIGCPLCFLHVVHPWPLGAGCAYFDYEGAEQEHASHCDLCGAYATDFVPVAERDRYGFQVSTRCCAGCGLLFQYPRLAPAGLRALYSGPYRALVSAWHGREINAQTLYGEQVEYGKRLSGVLWRELGHGDEDETCAACFRRRVLDLGGSTGRVAHVVGWHVSADHVTVVEPGMAEAAVAVGNVHRVVVQSAEDFDPGEEKWDLVLLCQTVDHLRSISAVLRKVKGLLAPGGRFFVDAVDSSLIPEPVRYKVDHIYSLTPATMRAYLERAGFVAREVPAPSENHVAFLCEVAS